MPSESSESSSSISTSSVSSSSSSSIVPYHIKTGSVVTGTPFSGSYTNTWAKDGSLWRIFTVKAQPSLDIQCTFEAVPDTHHTLIISGYYLQIDIVPVYIRVYNYTTGEWDELTGTGSDFPNAGSVHDYYFWLPRDMTDYKSGGQVKISFYKPLAGEYVNLFALDEVLLEEDFSSSSHSSSSWSTASSVSSSSASSKSCSSASSSSFSTQSSITEESSSSSTVSSSSWSSESSSISESSISASSSSISTSSQSESEGILSYPDYKSVVGIGPMSASVSDP